jgi:predicted TIM-barrel fold metal-dependent hydrolase
MKQVSEMTIDADVHPVIANEMTGILEYAPAGVRGAVQALSQEAAWEAGRPVGRYTNPSPGLIRGNLRSDAVSTGGEVPGSDPRFVAVDHLDAHRIEAAVLIPLAFEIWLNMGYGSAIISALNDYLIDRWLSVDRRYRLAAAVFPLDVEAAVAEIERLSGNPAVVAVSVPLLSMPLGHPHYRPICAAAEAAELPIFLHPSGGESTYVWAPSLAGGVPSNFVERHVALAQVAESNFANLILSGMFDRFPRLKVVFVEYGFTWAAALTERMDREWTRLDGRLRPTRELPSVYLARNVRFTTQPLEEPAQPRDMVELLKAMHAEQTLLFSSDYPHWDTDNPDKILRYLDADMRQRVFRGNALETLRLEPASVA